MTVMTAGEVARRCGGRVEGDAGTVVDSWSFDSRALAPGSCFVALHATRDGHDFLGQAFVAGARVALVDRALPAGFDAHAHHTLVRVDDTLGALQAVATSLRADRADLRVVAVAGSTGKTSTKDLLAAALAPCGCYANAESFNNEFGLPITLCNAPAAARVVVTEMGERFPGDLATLCAIAQPNVGVITNVGLAHAEHLGGHRGTVAVLSELLDALPADGVAVLPADDPFVDDLAAATRVQVLRVGRTAVADVVVAGERVDDRLRPSFAIDGHEFTVPLHGAHHALNAAMAIAVAAHVFSVPWSEIATELAGAVTGRWRMELLETDDGIVVLNDAYNANPTSMRAALVASAHLEVPNGARRIAALGDMRELGEQHHAAAHREMGALVATLAIDYVVGVGDGGRLIAETAARLGVATEHVPDAARAEHAILGLAQTGDAVLVKGSRALALEHLADALLARGRARCAEGDRA